MSSRDHSATGIVRLACSAMATRFEFALGGGEEIFLRAAGEEALAEILACEQAISPFVRGSSIARVNLEADRRPVRVDPLTFELLEACARLWAETDGAFDPTVGPLMRALGFRGAPRADADLAAARATVGMDGVELDAATSSVRFARPGMELDVGAVGKGHALDLAAEVLREHGVRCAILHGGTSTVIAIGGPPDADGFRVAVGPGEGAPRAILRDAALSVSAAAGRSTADGAGHVLDPRTGLPVAADTATAAVIADRARDADAWSTALLALGDVDRAPPRASALISVPGSPPMSCDAGTAVRSFEFLPPHPSPTIDS